MQNVTVLPRRAGGLETFMASYLPYLQQQQASQDQQDQRDQQQKSASEAMAKKAYLDQISKLPPAQQAAAYKLAPPDVQAMMIDPSKLPTPPQTAEEQAQTRADQGLNTAMERGDPTAVPGQSMNAPAGSRMNMPPQIGVAGGGGDSPNGPANLGDTVPQIEAPSVRDKFNAWFAQQVKDQKGKPDEHAIAAQMTALSSDPTQFQPGDEAFVNATRIRDKQALSAEETTKVPLTQAEIAEKTAAAGEHRAVASKNYAEVGKLGEETKQLREGKGSADAKAVADAIVSGKQPPELTGLRGDTVKVRAELARQGYDMTKAEQDWKSTQKYLGTLNGAQQVRLRQAVDFTDESLGNVETLAKQWDAGRFPILNKANLTLATHGVYGKDAAQIATKLNSQINEVAADLAVVYRGGNSPTDEALKGATAMLNANWDKDVLLSNVGLIRQNLGYRRNSLKAAGVAGNAGNTYDISGGGQAGAPGPVVGTYVPGQGLVRH